MRKTYRIVRQGPNRKYYQPQRLSIYLLGWVDIGGWCNTLEEAEEAIKKFDGNPLPGRIAKGPFKLEKPAPAQKPEAAPAVQLADAYIGPGAIQLRHHFADVVDQELARARQRAEDMRREFMRVHIPVQGPGFDKPVLEAEDKKPVGWWG